MMFHSAAPRGRKFARMMLAPMLVVAPMLGLGAALSATPALAKDAAPKYSEKFIAAAGPLQTALGKVPKGQKPDAATLDSLKKQLDASVAVATTPDDKNAAGGFAVAIGSMAQDVKIQSQGVHLLIDSGKSQPDQLPKLHYYLGSFAYQGKDYATAQAEMKIAIAGGYKGADVMTMLAEAQFASNQTADGLVSLQQAIDVQKASGQAVPADWYDRGIQIAYKAKLVAQSAQMAAELAGDYPTNANWALAIQTLRESAQYAPRERLDLMRLMGRTNSYTDGNDYLIYVDDLDPHRLPGEAEKVLDAGIATGKLKQGNVAVDDSLHIVKSRVAADRASLPALERDARAPKADAHTAMIAGDVLLGYGEAAKAQEMFTLALTKPGVDANVANTRLGIAQCDAGDYVGAQATFAKVTGARTELAKLWIIYAKQKAAGK